MKIIYFPDNKRDCESWDMKKTILMIPLILIFLSTISSAEDNSIYVDGNITINVVSWVEDNESRFNITINPNDIRDNQYKKENVNKIENDFFDFIIESSKTCNNTVLGELTQECLNHFDNYNITGLIECETQKQSCMDNKNHLNSEYAKLNIEKDNLTEELKEFEQTKGSYNICSGNLNTCSLEKKNIGNQRYWIGGIGILIIIIVIFRRKQIEAWLQGRGGVKTPASRLTGGNEPKKVESEEIFKEKREWQNK